jgi:hypothetical protein
MDTTKYRERWQQEKAAGDKESQAVYEAEWVLTCGEGPSPLGAELLGGTVTVQRLREYARRLQTMDWFRSRFPGFPELIITISTRENMKKAAGGDNLERDAQTHRPLAWDAGQPVLIEIASETIQERDAEEMEALLLHELAHAGSRSQHPRGHGGLFRRAMLTLVGHQLGREARESLQREFKVSLTEAAQS